MLVLECSVQGAACFSTQHPHLAFGTLAPSTGI